MSHPLVEDNAKYLRQRMASFLKGKSRLGRKSNIIFVCGGNEVESLRIRFRIHSNVDLKNYKILFPERALEFDFLGQETRLVDLREFEKFLANISACVVIFPESPGSFTELGLFSAWKDVSKKILVVLDSKYQGNTGFLVTGAVNPIDVQSEFKNAIQLDYSNPNFDHVVSRIVERNGKAVHKRKFEKDKWIELDDFEKMSIVHWIIATTRVSSFQTVCMLFRSFFGNVSERNIGDICSVLECNGEVRLVGGDNLLTANGNVEAYLQPVEGFEIEYLELRQEILDFYSSDETFYPLFQEVVHAS